MREPDPFADSLIGPIAGRALVALGCLERSGGELRNDAGGVVTGIAPR